MAPFSEESSDISFTDLPRCCDQDPRVILKLESVNRIPCGIDGKCIAFLSKEDCWSTIFIRAS